MSFRLFPCFFAAFSATDGYGTANKPVSLYSEDNVGAMLWEAYAFSGRCPVYDIPCFRRGRPPPQ